MYSKALVKYYYDNDRMSAELQCALHNQTPPHIPWHYNHPKGIKGFGLPHCRASQERTEGHRVNTGQDSFIERIIR